MYRVLIVDDEIPFLQSLMLFDWGAYNCRCVGQATNGREALEKCVELAPHIVISDINMPSMDGLSFLSELNKRFPEIQVVLLTVHRDFEYAQKAVNLGACDYLVKDMDYRNQLPSVLEKAKKPFEQQPSNLNHSANLLHRSGHMLVIESDDTLHAYIEEVDQFFKQHSGTLITAKLPQRYDSLHSLISQLDLLLSSDFENIGLIIRSTSCFELITRQKIQPSSNWLRQMLTHNRFQPIEKQACFALTVSGNSVRQYVEAHDFNVLMLERGFYTALPQIVRSKQTKFEYLPSAIMDNWLRRFDVLKGTDGEVSKLLNEIISEAKNNSFYPPMIREAFDRILYKYELRYAASSDEKAHAFLLNAPDIQSLANKLLETMDKIRVKQNNYSFYIVRAKEYIAAHLGEPSLQLVEVAEHVGISPGYLSKKLKEETGQTFQEQLICMRMEYASKLLKNSDKMIYEISEIVGYENYRSFTAAFSSYYGVSPKKHRWRSQM